MKVKISELYDVGSSKRVFQSEWKDSGIPFYRAREIAKLAIDGYVDNELFIDEELYETYVARYGKPQSGDVMITGVGTLGVCYVVQESDRFYFKDGNILWFRQKAPDRILPEFLVKAFASQEIKDYISKNSSGTTVGTFTIQTANKMEITLPSIEEQRVIISKISLVEEIIKNRKKELQKLDELVKARFVEMFGECKNEVLIGDVISICRGASPRPIQAFITDDEDGVNWIKIGDVSENSLYITQTAERITQEGAKKSRAVHKGDFILSNSMSFGRPYILGIDGCVHDGWLILSEFRETFDELYLYHALRSEHVQHQFSGKVNGATVKNLNSDLVKATYIQVPDMETQYEFADFVKQVDKSKVVCVMALQAILE